MRRRPGTVRRPVVPLAVALAVAVLGAACSPEDGGSTRADPSPPTVAPAVAASRELPPLSVEGGRIVDDQGRWVLLRGANVNALGDYHRADPALPPTVPVTDADWRAMAAHGLSVVRLLMSWSALEPEPGQVDDGELRRVRRAVDAANRHGLYVVLDLHQDAWSATLATPEGTDCPAGTAPAIGWDGAPGWATLSENASTCVAGGRESAPAVRAAFRNFYANTDGIRDRAVALWGTIAAEFAGTPGVAGYDLLNEPNIVLPVEQSVAGYTEFVAGSLDAIRASERAAGARPTPVFVEPFQTFPTPDFVPDPARLQDGDLVFAPHNYAESIGQPTFTIEQTLQLTREAADRLGPPGDPAALWIGEYGWWDTGEESLSEARRNAAAEDRLVIGGAWWQWRQACGDPHSVGRPGARATEDQVHLVRRRCPADTDGGLTEEFVAILGRAYPRAAPGQVAELRSDPATGELVLRGADAPPGGRLVVWLPDPPQGAPVRPTATGLDDLTTARVAGGRWLTATTTGGDYSLGAAPVG